MNKNNIKKYLPSRKFGTIILTIIIGIVIFFVVKEGILLIKNGNNINQKNNSVGGITIKSVIQKDSNNNGIEDWEEYLWGLDPNKNGPENKEFILSKKKALKEEGIINQNNGQNEEITGNAMLSRQLLATILALQQDGGLSEENIESITNSIGGEIKTTPIPDIYTKDMLKTIDDGMTANSKYLSEWKRINDKYSNSDMGQELIIIAQGIVANDKQAMYSVGEIAKAYRNFGIELSEISVPNSLIQIHLNLINNYEKNAKTIEEMQVLVDEPIIGMKGLLNYKKYNDALISNIENLTKILQ